MLVRIRELQVCEEMANENVKMQMTGQLLNCRYEVEVKDCVLCRDYQRNWKNANQGSECSTTKDQLEVVEVKQK